MQLLYTSTATKVLRIEDLATDDRREDHKDDDILVYDSYWDGTVNKKAASLDRNTTPYHERGWCVAERQWSACASKPSQLLPVPVDERGIPSAKTGLAPMLPAKFESLVSLENLKFTHRDDLDSVVALQRRVFEEMAEPCPELTKANLPLEQMHILAASLQSFKKLQKLTLKNCDLDVAVVDGLMCNLGKVETLAFQHCKFTSEIMKTVMQRLSNRSRLKVLDLRQNCLTDEEAKIIEEGFKGRLPTSLENVILSQNDINPHSVHQLEQRFKFQRATADRQRRQQTARDID